MTGLRMPLNERVLHGQVYGRTGSGKSYWAKHIFKSLRVRAVYVSPKDSVQGVRSYKTWDVRRLREPASKMHLHVPEDMEASRELVNRMRLDLQRWADAAGDAYGEHAPLCYIFHDEYQREAPDHHNDGAVRPLVTQGRSRGLGHVGITQAPTQASARVRAQRMWTALFALTSEERSWMTDADVPDHIREHVAWDGLEPTYRYAIEAGDEWVPMEALSV